MEQTQMLTLAFLVSARFLPTSQAAAPIVPSREIHLVITEASGNPLPGVSVSALTASEQAIPEPRALKDAGRLKIADAEGRVVFRSLPEGTYYIRLELSGFLTETIGPVAIGKPCVRLPELHVVLPAWESTCF